MSPPRDLIQFLSMSTPITSPVYRSSKVLASKWEMSWGKKMRTLVPTAWDRSGGGPRVRLEGACKRLELANQGGKVGEKGWERHLGRTPKGDILRVRTWTLRCGGVYVSMCVHTRLCTGCTCRWRWRTQFSVHTACTTVYAGVCVYGAMWVGGVCVWGRERQALYRVCARVLGFV